MHVLFAAADFLGVEQLKLMTVRRPRHTPEAQIPVLTVPIAPPEPPHGVCAVQVAKIEAELSTANVCHTLTVADNHSASQLKETCIAFIVMHFKEVRHAHPLMRILSCAWHVHRLHRDAPRGGDACAHVHPLTCMACA